MGSSSKNPPLPFPNRGGGDSESLIINGLKFGQKIYFEDVGNVSPAKSGGGSSSDGGGGGGKRPPPRCQVEGCRVDLSDAKAYYGRHKVCALHSKTPKVVVNGLDQRFCQQCSRFHQLPEFDQGKRSCRRRLAGHNERRRKPSPGSLFSAPYGRLSSSVFETGKGGGFLMDFSTYPKLSTTETWPPTIIRPQTHNHHHSAPSMGALVVHSTMSNNPSFPQGSSSSGTRYNPMGPTVPSSGEYLSGGAHLNNSGCALSLLSNETRMVPHDGPFEGAQMAHMVHSTIATTHPVNQFNGTPWDGAGSHETPCHLGLSRVALPDNQYSVGPTQHNMQYVDHEHTRAFDSSTQFMNWSL